MGTCYGIVPYVDHPNTGTITGIVGAGGNVGGAFLGYLFIYFNDYPRAMEYMGYFTLATALLTPWIVIPGHRGIVFGHDDEEEAADVTRSPLLVPKLHHSPHWIRVRRSQRKEHD